jgi:hypothetical protein
MMPGMLGAYASCAIIFVAASLLGRAVQGLCGADRWSWTAPAVGFAALLVVVDVTIRLPGGGWASLGAVVVLLVLSISVIARKGLGIGVGALILISGPVIAVVAVLASGNYLINDNFGIPGVSILNDFAGHLPWAEALSAHDSPFTLILPGYPLGCFALAGTLGKLPGISVLAAFQGILIVTPVLIAVTTIALFEPLSMILRVIAAAVVSLAYLITSALAEGAFKEPIEALFIVAIALLLKEIAQGSVRRSQAVGVPVAVLIAGSVANYSYPGLLWPLLIVALWAVLEVLRRRHAISRSLVAHAIRTALAGMGVLVLLSLPEIVRFHAFEQGQVSTINAQTGNVPTPLPWRETLGIWFSDDFRLWQTQSLNFQHALLIFALAVFAFGVVQAWRRGESSLLALLAAALVVALYTRHTANAYNGAKAMMVLSCAVALVCIRGVLPTSMGSSRRGMLRASRLQLAGTLVAVGFAAACLWSDALAQRGSRVGPSSHTHELAQLDPMLAGHTVLFLAQDDFAAWELRGTHLGYLTTYDIPSLPVAYRGNQPFVVGEPADFNTFTTQTLNDFSYVVATNSDFASVPPANWRPVAATRFYQVWARSGSTTQYSSLAAGSAPGAILDCATPLGQKLRRTHGIAMVQAPPIMLDGDGWQGPVFGRQAGVSALTAGMAVNQQVTLPPGHWQVSLQYTSSTSVVVRTRGLNSVLPATLEQQGPYWTAGEIISTGRPLTIQVKVDAPPPLATSRSALLGDVAFVRVDVAPRTLPLRAACGRYVDWYRS